MVEEITLRFRPDARLMRAQLGAEDRWLRGGLMLFSPIVLLAALFPLAPGAVVEVGSLGEVRAFQSGGLVAALVLVGGAAAHRFWRASKLAAYRAALPETVLAANAAGLSLTTGSVTEMRPWRSVLRAHRSDARAEFLFEDGAVRVAPFSALPDGVDGAAFWVAVSRWREAA